MKKLSWILMSIALMALSANATLSFTDITAELPTYTGLPGTVCWGDVDNDGDQDLFIGSLLDHESALFTNNNGEWQNSTADYGVSNLLAVRTAKFVDYNRDGWLDLLCTNSNVGISLLRQSPLNHRLQSVELDADDALNIPIRSVNLCDVNQDGQLDLFLSNSSTLSGECLALLQDEENFTEERDGSPFTLPFDNNTKGAVCVLDFDRDGDQDYFFGTVPDQSKTKLFSYDSRRRSYQDVTTQVLLPINVCPTGAVWADFNNDDRLDLFCPGMSEDCRLYYSRVPDQQIKFEDVSMMQGFLPAAARSEYAHAVDVNMDGWMDIFIPREGPHGCSLLINHGGRWWEDVAPALGITNANIRNYACAWSDIDNDGDLDFVLAQSDAGVRLYRNDLTDSHEFINLTLCGTFCDSPLQGANVHFKFENAKQVSSTWITSCTLGGDAPMLQFCNSSLTKSALEEVLLTIEWPNGIRQEIPGDQLTMWKNNVIHQPLDEAPHTMLAPEAVLSVSEVNLSNSPNPFNPNTQISFTLSQDGRVDLAVYNVLGQEVAVLANDNFSAGTHSVEFNAAGLPSGLYLAKLSALGHTAVHRLMLAK